MLVEEPDLGTCRRANEAGALIKLRASLHAAAAGYAARDRIGFLLLSWRDTRTGPEIIRAIDRHPGFYSFQVLKDHAAINGQIADDRELAERFQTDRLLQLIDQSRTCHPGFAIDEHGTGATNFFQAVGIVSDGSRGLAIACDWIGGDFHHGRNYVHSRLPGEFKFLPARAGFGILLAFDLENDGLCAGWGH